MANDENSGWPLACFFKLILKPQLDLHKLKIPSKFMKAHGDDLSKIIYLNTPTGKVWNIKLVRENGDAFLQNGWSEFGKFYLLSYYYFLLFKYEGNSRFTVIIFDQSTSEIEYSLDPQASRDTPSKQRKTIDHPEQSRPTKTGKKMENIMDDKLIISQNKRYKKGFNTEEINRVRAYAELNCYKPSFAAKMQLSCVASIKSLLSIPKEFVRRYLDSKPWAFNLQMADAKKTWPVKTTNSTEPLKICVGWKTFALDNKLRVGDICIFELVRKQKLKVHILRAAKAEVYDENSRNRN